MLALARDHGARALEGACARTLILDAIGYGSVRRLLSMAPVQTPTPAPVVTHEETRRDKRVRFIYRLRIDESDPFPHIPFPKMEKQRDQVHLSAAD